MLESFSACGSFVHTPCGPRKSGIPDSVEMPAPVRITMCLASSSHVRTEAIDGSKEVISLGFSQHSGDVLGAFTSSIWRGSRHRQRAPEKPAPTPRRPEDPRARLLLRIIGDQAFGWFARARGHY